MYLAKKAFNGLGQGFEGKLCKLFLSDYFDHFGMCAHEMMILQKPDLNNSVRVQCAGTVSDKKKYKHEKYKKYLSVQCADTISGMLSKERSEGVWVSEGGQVGRFCTM